MTEFVVTTSVDENDGGVGGAGLSLRDALVLAQDGDTISFSAAAFFVDDNPLNNTAISVGLIGALGELVITQDNLTINGDIDGDGIADVRLFGRDDTRLMRLDGTATGVTLNALTFDSGSVAFGAGGGLRLDTGSSATVRNSTFMDNYAPSGGAIWVSSGAALTLTGSTVQYNSAREAVVNTEGYGGGIATQGALTVINSTIADNTAAVDAGVSGMGGASSVTLTHTTVTGNIAREADAVDSDGTLTLNNSIVVGNTTAGYGVHVGNAANLTLNGGNILEDVSATVSTAIANQATGDIVLGVGNAYTINDVFQDVQTQALGGVIGNLVTGDVEDNGGPTQTVEIKRTGIAEDAGGSVLAGATTDQRGFERTARVDAGSFETGPLVVDSTGDGDDNNFGTGELTLREAVRLAEAGDIIRFSSDVFSADENPLNNTVLTISGASSIVVDKALTIDGDINGDGIADVTLDANANARHLSVQNTGDLTLESLHLTNGSTTFGGAVAITAAGGNLTLRNTLFTDNSGSYGGAVDVYSGTAVVYNSYFSGNSASALGGAITVYGGDLTVVNSTFAGNTATNGGSAIDVQNFTDGGPVDFILANSTITGNITGSGGDSGAINGIGTNTTIVQSIIAGNSAPVATDDATITDSTVGGSGNIFGSAVAGTFTDTTILGTGNAHTVADIFATTGPVSHDGATVTAGTAGLNGGPVPTVALLRGGIAVDQVALQAITTETDIGIDLDGDGFTGTTRLSDARGVARPDGKTSGTSAATDFGDIGAFEFQPTLIVNTGGDVDDGLYFGPGQLTLREALKIATTGVTIRFDEDHFNSIDGIVDLIAPLTVTVNGIIIDGDTDGDGESDIRITTTRDDIEANLGLMQVAEDVTGLHLRHLTFEGGETNNGGALVLRDNSQATVERSYFLNNTAVPDGEFDGNGGAIDAQAGSDLTVFGSTFYNNSAAYGGAISVDNANVRIDHSTFVGNTATEIGGAIQSFTSAAGSGLKITNSTITGNTAMSSEGLGGGGLYVEGTRAPTVANTIIAGNAGRVEVAGSQATNWNSDVAGTISTAGGNIFGGDHGTDTVAGEGANDLILGQGNAFDVSDLFADTRSVSLQTSSAAGAATTQSVTLGNLSALDVPLPVAPLEIGGPGIDFGLPDLRSTEQDLGLDLNGDETIDATRVGTDQSGNARIFGAGMDSGAVERVAIPNPVVDNTGDVDDGDVSAGQLTLREAIRLAEDGDTITFDETVFTPSADGSALTAISLQPQATGNSGLRIDKSLTIDGDVNGDGVMDVQVSGFSATTFTIEAEGGEVVLRNIHISDGGETNPAAPDEPQYGGNINLTAGTAVLVNTVVSDGAAHIGGGGIHAGAGTTLRIVNSSIIDNIVRYSDGSDDGVPELDIAGQFGGGIAFAGDVLTIVNSTISGNSIERGDATVANDPRGAGLYVDSETGNAVTVINSTIFGNTFGAAGPDATGVGGIHVADEGAVQSVLVLANSIVANNADQELGGLSAGVLDAGGNLLGEATLINTPGVLQLGVGNDFDIDDVFASTTPQVVNGQTHFALNPTGIAVDAGSDGNIPRETGLGVDVDGSGTITTDFLDTDQVGAPRVQGNSVDMGAVETAGPRAPVTHVVDTTSIADDGNTGAGQFSLSEAVRLAQAGDTITFATSVFGAGDANVTNNVEIDFGDQFGTGLDIDVAVTIDGDLNDDGVADVTLDRDGVAAGRFFDVGLSGADPAVLDGLVLSGGGMGETGGGAIDLRSGTLNIYASAFQGNSAAVGGALRIAADATANIANSTFAENNAVVYAGAIVNMGALRAVNTTFYRNRQDSDNPNENSGGGAILSQPGSATLLHHVTATGNSSTGGDGGFAAVGTDATLQISNSIVAGNQARTGSALDDIAATAETMTTAGGNIFGSPVTATALDEDTETLVLGVANAYTAANVFAQTANLALVEGITQVGRLSLTSGTPGVLPNTLGLASGSSGSTDITETTLGFDVDRNGSLGTDEIRTDKNLARRGDGEVFTWDLGAIEVSPTPVLVNGRFVPVAGYDPRQDTGGLAAVSDVASAGYVMALANDSWKALQVDATITEDSWITFLYLPNNNGEIHGFQFETDLSQSFSDLFKLHGTQELATDSGYVSNFTPVNDQLSSFAIPVGQFIAPGDYPYLVLFVDVDNGPARDDFVTSTFANIQIFDAPPVRIDVSATNGDGQTSIVDTNYFVQPFDPVNQDRGTATVSADRTAVTLTGNAWKKILTPYADIEADLVLSFDMRATDLGELTMVGFDTDDSFNSFSTFFRLGGSDPLGPNFAGTPTYTQAGGTQHFEITVGELLEGRGAQNIVFVVDDDANGSGAATFSNIEIFERAPLLIDGTGYRVRTYDDRQDQGAATVSADQSAITVSSNGWKRVAIDQELDADTVLSFTLASADVGEFLAIGFDTDARYNGPQRFIKLGGAETPGGLGGTLAYAGAGAEQSYRIRLGDHFGEAFSGTFENLVFVADDDADQSGIATFRDISLLNGVLVNDTSFVPQTYGGSQDAGTATVSADGTAVTVTGNGWKRLEVDQTITEDTVLIFDMQSSDPGEVSMIGFDTDTAFNSYSTFFELGGTDPSNARIADTLPYTRNGNTQHYEIAVGSYFTGDFANLALVVDDDANGSGAVTFSNIQLVERAPLLIDGTGYRVQTYDTTQDQGAATVSVDQSAITVSSNGWKRVAIDQALDADTVLSFTLASADVGEFLAIGFDTDARYNGPQRFIKLGGTETPGGLGGTLAYAGAGEEQAYRIRLGDHFGEAFSGTFENLLFVADDDADQSGSAIFSDISLLNGVLVNDTSFEPQTYGGSQDAGTATVSADGTAVTVTGNGWKRLEVDQTITEDTVLIFDMRATDPGEVSMIGFDTDTAFNSYSTFFELGGTDPSNARIADTLPYTRNGNTQHYEIAVGSYFTGDFANLALVVDDDANGSGAVTFSNIQLVERAPLLIDGTGYRVQTYDTTQDQGAATVSADQSAITVSSNGWKRVELSHAVTAGTVLTFDLASADVGEFLAIGFDTDARYNGQSRYFKLGGTEGDSNLADEFIYTGDGRAQRVELRLGDYFEGFSFTNMVLVVDDDADQSGIATFSNFSISDADRVFVSNSSFVPEGIYTAADNTLRQDSAGSVATVSASGSDVTITGNAWKAFDVDVTLTENTRIAFKMASADVGEFLAIGFDNDRAFNGMQEFYRIAGNVGGTAGAVDYTGGGDFQQFDIAVGEDFTGAFEYLVLAADDDADGSGTATFRDIEIIQAPFTVEVIAYGQDSQGVTGQVGELHDGGALKLTKNAWRSILTEDLEVDANTVLSFDFRSDVEGEVQGIGLDNNSSLSPDTFYQLLGTQDYGLQSANDQYTAGQGYETFEIAIGQDFQGTFDRIVLAMDDDRANSTSDAYFSYITLTGLGASDTTINIL